MQDRRRTKGDTLSDNLNDCHDLSCTIVSYQTAQLKSKAEILAEKTGLACYPAENLQRRQASLALMFSAHERYDFVVELQSLVERSTPIRVDFDNTALSYRQRFGGGRRQAIGRAIGLKSDVKPTVIDATAGLGKDAFVLASLGCEVILVERNPIIFSLLADGVRRYVLSNNEIADRMSVIHSDSKTFLQNIQNHRKVDSIYLDPMYPHRRKSALVKKEMRILRQVVGDDGDITNLLNIAVCCPVDRVVVKRPSTAPVIDANIQPNHAISTKNTRYDVYCNLQST